MPSQYPGSLDNVTLTGTKIPPVLQMIVDVINRLQLVHRVWFRVSSVTVVAGVVQADIPTHGLYHQVIATQRTTISGPTNTRPGVELTIEVTQDANGGWDCVWDSTFNVSPSAPAGGKNPGAVVTYTWKYNGTKWMLINAQLT